MSFHQYEFHQSAKDKAYFKFIEKMAHLLRDSKHIETDFRIGILISLATTLAENEKALGKEYRVNYIKKDISGLLFNALKTIPNWFVGKEKDYKGYHYYVKELAHMKIK